MVGRTKMWVAVSFVLACAGAQVAMAQDRSVVCESIDNGRNSCPMRTDGHIRLAEQLSKAPCVKHQNWDVESGGVWVSNGCRGRFELVRDEEDRRGDSRGFDDRRDQAPPPPPPPPPSDGASARLQSKCAHRVADYRRISPDDAIPQGSRVVSDGLFEVTIGTPQGPMVCTVDNDGNVRGVNEAQ